MYTARNKWGDWFAISFDIGRYVFYIGLAGRDWTFLFSIRRDSPECWCIKILCFFIGWIRIK